MFRAKQRGLIDATATCQCWLTVLLSPPPVLTQCWWIPVGNPSVYWKIKVYRHSRTARAGILLGSPQYFLFTLEEAGNRGNHGVLWTPNLAPRHRAHVMHERTLSDMDKLHFKYAGAVSDVGEGPHQVPRRHAQ